METDDLTPAKERMLDATEKLFMETGGKGFTLRKLAKAMGLTAPAVYIHFKDRSDLLIRMLGRRMLRKATAWRKDNPIPEDLDTHGRIRYFVKYYLQISLEDYPVYLELFKKSPAAFSLVRDALRTGDLSNAQNARFFKDLLLLWTTELLGAPPEKDFDANLVFIQFWALLHGSVIIWGPLLEEGMNIDEALSQIMPSVELWLKGYELSQKSS